MSGAPEARRPSLDEPTPDDDQIIQKLPPLRGVPFGDPRRVAAYYDRLAAADAGSPAGASATPADATLAPLPPWELAPGVDQEARGRVLGWVREAARLTRRPVLDLGCGEGRALAELGLGAFAAVGLELAPGLARRAAGVARRAAAEATRIAEEEAKRAASSAVTWWAGSGAPPPPAVAVRPHRPAPVVQGDAARPPFRDGAFGCVLAASVLHHVGEWAQAVAAWARLVTPGGALVIAGPAEKDQDEPGFLSVSGRTIWPGIVTGFPRSQDLTWVLSAAGLEVGAVSVYRVRRTHAELEAEAERAGADPRAWRALCEEASESLRALYEIDEEGLSWRYLAVRATRPRG